MNSDLAEKSFRPVCAVLAHSADDRGEEFESLAEAREYCAAMETLFGRSGENKEFPVIVCYLDIDDE